MTVIYVYIYSKTNGILTSGSSFTMYNNTTANTNTNTNNNNNDNDNTNTNKNTSNNNNNDNNDNTNDNNHIDLTRGSSPRRRSPRKPRSRCARPPT